MPVKFVLIQKDGRLKDATIKTFKLADLYKKCKFKNDSDFVGRATWKHGDKFVTLFAKDAGRAGGENKYDLPPPVDTTLYFGTMVVITMFAAMSFDPRLIWDCTEENHESRK